MNMSNDGEDLTCCEKSIARHLFFRQNIRFDHFAISIFIECIGIGNVAKRYPVVYEVPIITPVNPASVDHGA